MAYYQSLQTGIIPSSLKAAQLTPIIKKANLDPESLSNYRPISNLNYISELVECAVVSQLATYLTDNDLLEPHQSAYRPSHFMETALISIMDNLLRALDDPRPVLLGLLDCSAAFDLVSHEILLDRMQNRLGISGPALLWFRSYLTDRSQCLSNCQQQVSTPPPFPVVCPRGRSLDPYYLPSTPYPWGTSSALTMQASTSTLMTQNSIWCAITMSLRVYELMRLEACIGDIRLWMPLNQLKLNNSKTEFLFIHSKFRDELSTPTIRIGDDNMSSSSTAGNLGVLFDDSLTLAPCQPCLQNSLLPNASHQPHKKVSYLLLCEDYCSLVSSL